MAWLCDIDPSSRGPCEGPDYGTVTTGHQGDSGIVNGRNASNALDFHMIKVGRSGECSYKPGPALCARAFAAPARCQAMPRGRGRLTTIPE